MRDIFHIHPLDFMFELIDFPATVEELPGIEPVNAYKGSINE